MRRASPPDRGLDPGARDHVGIWAHEDDDIYLGIALEVGGTCKVVVASKRGPGVGYFCAYSQSDRTITITEEWEYGGARGKPPEPIQLKYDPERDEIVVGGEKRYVLRRSAKLVEG